MIVIMRHGEAEFSYGEDSKRELTERGRIFVKEQSLFLKESGISFNTAFCSPYIRAKQTFEIVQSVIQVNKVNYVDDLVPSGSDLVADYLEVMEEECGPNLLVVSHLPLVASLVDRLTSNTENFDFNPGSFCILEKKDNFDGYKIVFCR